MSKEQFSQRPVGHIAKEQSVPAARLPVDYSGEQRRRRLIWLILFIALITLTLTVIFGYFALYTR